MADVSRPSGSKRTAPSRTPRLRTRGRAKKTPSADLTPRGQRTKETLLAAARAIFESDGFLEARITDIADAASVAHGTFYTYFESKEDILRAVGERLIDELTPATEIVEGADPRQLIAQANSHYWVTFRANRGLFRALDQVASFHPAGQEMRRAFRHRYERTAEVRIASWQQAGIIPNDLDPHLTAMAMTALVGRFTKVCLALEPETGDEPPAEQALDVLNTLYARAIGLVDPTPKGVKAGRTRTGRS